MKRYYITVKTGEIYKTTCEISEFEFYTQLSSMATSVFKDNTEYRILNDNCDYYVRKSMSLKIDETTITISCIMYK